MNNLTTGNSGDKARELSALVVKRYHPWFVNYLVVKRAAQVGQRGGWRHLRAGRVAACEAAVRLATAAGFLRGGRLPAGR
jgi:hypothetical protein